MRMIAVAILLMTSSASIASEIDEARDRAVVGRDSYWNCLAQEYPRDSNVASSEPEFISLVEVVCPSERQNFRVSLLEYLSLQFPDESAEAHLTTANRAIERAQMDIVTAFIKRRAAVK